MLGVLTGVIGCITTAGADADGVTTGPATGRAVCVGIVSPDDQRDAGGRDRTGDGGEAIVAPAAANLADDRGQHGRRRVDLLVGT